MSAHRPLRRGIAGLTCVLSLSIPTEGARSDAIPLIHNLAIVEFVDSPPTGLVVSGGLLGVADSSGAFPVPYKRFDPVTGNFADPGRVAGDALVFANLRPGRYRLALVFLHESRIATKLLPKHKEKFEDRCMVYSDSLPDLTFTIADGEVRYVGRVIRRVLPTLNQEDLWKTRVEWTPGDEQRALKSLGKRKDMAPWRELLLARLAMLDSSAARVR